MIHARIERGAFCPEGALAASEGLPAPAGYPGTLLCPGQNTIGMATYDLGFLGGGQLARMSIQAAQRMGLRCLSLDPAADSPASQIAPAFTGRLNDPAAIARVLDQCERVTFENEFIPADAVREALKRAGRREEVIVPGVDTLASIQDKLRQREALAAASVPSPRALAIDPSRPADAEELGYPMVLKARFGGYDGKGTRYARDSAEFESHRSLWTNGGWLAEEYVAFRRELSVMVAVGEDLALELPPMETIQSAHVCDLTYPATQSEIGPANTLEVPRAAVNAVGGRGLFGVELFELSNGQVLVNEIAPRPHNTGHYTLDWGALSQFDLHVRLALGLALPDVVRGVDVAMANLLGQPGARSYRAGLPALLRDNPEIRFHWYGKAESKPGRKMGHLNMPLADVVPIGEQLAALRSARARYYESDR